MRIIAWGIIANLVAAAVALSLVTAATQPPADTTIAEGKPHVGIAPAPLPPLRRLRRDTPEKDGRDPEKASYTPDGHWDLCHYHYQAGKDKYELLNRISSEGYFGHLALHTVDVPLELFQRWAYVVTPRCLRVDKTCNVVGEVCSGRGQCMPQYASGRCTCGRGWAGYLCEQDAMPPEFQSCPKDLHVTGAGPRTKVAWPTPTATDNSDEAPTITQRDGPGNGELFEEGKTSVVYVASDNAGNLAVCSFNVIVTLDTPLSLDCPNDVHVNTDTGKPTGQATYPLPALHGGVGVTTVLQKSPARPRSGDQFAIGETAVVFQATDSNGLTAVCEITVHVMDNEAPRISCPLSFVVENDEGEAAADVAWEAAQATDNSGFIADLFLESLVADPRGDTDGILPLGVHTMTYIAIDTAKNSAECAFNITVLDRDAPVVTCPAAAAVVVEADPATGTAPRPADLSMGVAASDDTGVVALLVCSSPDQRSAWPEGTYVVSCTATDGSGNEGSCTYSLLVEVYDKEPPVVQCPPSLVVDANPATGHGRLDWGELEATDNVGVVGPVTCLPRTNQFPLGLTKVTCVAKDAAGNIGVCGFKVKVEDKTAPTIACPATVIAAAVNATGLNYKWVVTSADETGGPTAVSCRVDSSGPVLTPPQFAVQVAIGATANITCASVDEAGNSAACSFAVTVADLLPPEFAECLASLNFPPRPIMQWKRRDGIVYARVALVVPAASDAVDGAVDVGMGLTVGAHFTTTATTTTPTTTTTTTTTTAAAATITTTTTTADADAGEEGSGGVGDISGESVVSRTTIMELALGSTGILFTAVDAAGNNATCHTAVEIRDTVSPVFPACQDDIAIGTDAGKAYSTVVTWPTPEATDDTGIPPLVTRTGGPEPGSQFPLGSRTVTYTAIDVGGNVAVCEFDVVVTDQEAPTVRVSPVQAGDNPRLVVLDNGDVYAFSPQLDSNEVIVVLPAPIVLDNLPGWTLAVARRDGLGLRDGYPEGATIVDFSATDAAGNVGRDILTVNVVRVCSPEQLGGALAWYSADVIDPADVAANTSKVTRWRDLSGNGHHLLQVAAGEAYQQPPELVVDATTGRPAVRFGGAEYLEVLTALSLEGTLAAVFDQSGAAIGARPMELLGQVQKGVSAASSVILRLDPSTPAAGGPALNEIRPPRPLPSASIRVNGASSNLFSPLAERKVVVGGLEAAAFNGRLSVGLGSTTTPHRHWHGDVSELVFFRQCVSADNTQRIEGYLAWKWGLAARLPPGHAFSAVPPTCKAAAPDVDFFLEGYLRQEALAWYSAGDYATDAASGAWAWPDRSANAATLRPSVEFPTQTAPTLLPYGEGRQPEVFFDGSNLLQADVKVDLTPSEKYDIVFAAVISSCAYDGSSKRLMGHLDANERVHSILRLEDTNEDSPVINKVRKATATRNSIMKGETVTVLPGGGNGFAKDSSFKIVTGVISRDSNSLFGSQFLSIGASERSDLPSTPSSTSKMWHGSVSEVILMKSSTDSRRRRDTASDTGLLTYYLGVKYGISTANNKGSTGDSGDSAGGSTISQGVFGGIVGVLICCIALLVVAIVVRRRRRKAVGEGTGGKIQTTPRSFVANPGLHHMEIADLDVGYENRVVEYMAERAEVMPDGEYALAIIAGDDSQLQVVHGQAQQEEEPVMALGGGWAGNMDQHRNGSARHAGQAEAVDCRVPQHDAPQDNADVGEAQYLNPEQGQPLYESITVGADTLYARNPNYLYDTLDSMTAEAVSDQTPM